MKDIVQDGHPALREVAAPVEPESITSAKIQQIITDMRNVLATQHDGVALAAPQIGVSLRIFIIAGKVFGERGEDMVFINPVSKKVSRNTEPMHEGCLSVRGLYGNVERHTKVKIEAYNKNGEQFVMKGKELIAQIFQHEMDHLDGILFTDKAIEVHETTEDDGVLKQQNKQ